MVLVPLRNKASTIKPSPLGQDRSITPIVIYHHGTVAPNSTRHYHLLHCPAECGKHYPDTSLVIVAGNDDSCTGLEWLESAV